MSRFFCANYLYLNSSPFLAYTHSGELFVEYKINVTAKPIRSFFAERILRMSFQNDKICKHQNYANCFKFYQCFSVRCFVSPGEENTEGIYSINESDLADIRG